MRPHRPARLTLLALSLAVAGCAGDGPSLPGTDGLPGGLPEVTTIKPAVAPADGPRPVGAPTEIYTRVARGILTCWFGANGPLKPAYIYHADAAPPSKGGGSVIAIHTRDKEVSDPRSIRAWKLAIVPAPEGTTLQVENRKLPPDYAERLERDVHRWAAGEEGCGEGPVTGGWGSQAAAPVPAKPATVKRTSQPTR